VGNAGHTVEAGSAVDAGGHPDGLSTLDRCRLSAGALTIIVRDQNTDRPLAGVQITVTERETNATQTVETDAQGRIVVDQLDPGLYAINLAKTGFAVLNKPSVRVITRKNSKVEFELGSVVLEEVAVLAQGADACFCGNAASDGPWWLLGSRVIRPAAIRRLHQPGGTSR
jgi:hypothetical protein